MKNIRLAILTALICLFSVNNLMSQVIIGIVTDGKDKSPLIGAVVSLKNTKIASTTDRAGKFTITADSVHKILVVNYVGYKTQEISIAGKSDIKVELMPAAGTLDEVVVIGYGTVKKSMMTGSVAVISGKTSGVSVRGVTSSTSTSTASKNISVPAGITSGTLTAGEINDFSKWILWNDKSQEELREHKKEWNMYPFIRFSVLVQNQDGFPMVDESVVLWDKNKETVWVAKTDNVGKAELWASMFNDNYTSKDNFSISVNSDGKAYSIQKAKQFNNGINQLTINKSCNYSTNVDVAFVVDATGSMTDELNYLKVELNDVMQKVKDSHKDLTLKLGSVYYRDHGDEYVTKKSDFSEDISKTVSFVKEQEAAGGGDFPEAVDEALDVAVNQLSWDKNSRAKILFLVLDAPPHQTPANLERMQKITLQAAALGIKIVPVTGSGINKSTEYLMRTLALSTNGTYVFLTNHSGIGDQHIAPTTDKYDVEKLNALLIRLFNQFTSVVTCTKSNLTDSLALVSDTTKMKGIIKSPTPVKPAKEGEEIKPVEKEFSCKFYPNPTSGTLNIDIDGKINEIFLSDLSGKILERFIVDRKKYVQINISFYPRGIYFMTYYGDYGKPTSGKIVLNK